MQYGGYAYPYSGYQQPEYHDYRGYQPQQPAQQMIPQQPPTQPQNAGAGLIWVQGEAGAKSYMVAPGCSVMLMDSENDVFYLKSADSSGMPQPLRIFDFVERKAGNAQAPQSAEKQEDYITRKEFDEFVKKFTSQKEDD